MKTKLSVIVPTLNEELCITDTLKSIANQHTTFDYNVFVCDGGSTDKTITVAKKYVNVLISPKRGKVYQLNFAAKKVDDDILVFIDADTIMPNNYLQRLHDLFESDDKLWACGARFRYFKQGYEWRQRLNIHIANLLIPRYFGISNLFGFTKIPGCNLAIKREIFVEVGGFKDIPNEDSALCTALKMLSKKRGYGKIKYIRKPVILSSPRKIIEFGPIGLILYYRNKEKKRFKGQKSVYKKLK